MFNIFRYLTPGITKFQIFCEDINNLRLCLYQNDEHCDKLTFSSLIKSIYIDFDKIIWQPEVKSRKQENSYICRQNFTALNYESICFSGAGRPICRNG